MTQVARRVRVSGLVQGVFFRAWTQQQAQQFGVRGWVRNHPDGSVEAHLEGEEDAVRRMIDLLGNGPPYARVDATDISDVTSEEFESFGIRH